MSANLLVVTSILWLARLSILLATVEASKTHDNGDNVSQENNVEGIAVAAPGVACACIPAEDRRSWILLLPVKIDNALHRSCNGSLIDCLTQSALQANPLGSIWSYTWLLMLMRWQSVMMDLQERITTDPAQLPTAQGTSVLMLTGISKLKGGSIAHMAAYAAYSRA